MKKLLWILPWVMTACGGSSATTNGSVSGHLVAESPFEMTLSNYNNLVSKVQGCGSSSGTRTSASEEAALVGSTTLNVSFASSTFSVTRNEQTVLSGAWREVDGSTIQIRAEGTTVILRVTLADQQIQFAIVNPSANTDCSQPMIPAGAGDAPSSAPKAIPPEEPAQAPAGIGVVR